MANHFGSSAQSFSTVERHILHDGCSDRRSAFALVRTQGGIQEDRQNGASRNRLCSLVSLFKIFSCAGMQIHRQCAQRKAKHRQIVFHFVPPGNRERARASAPAFSAESSPPSDSLCRTPETH